MGKTRPGQSPLVFSTHLCQFAPMPRQDLLESDLDEQAKVGHTHRGDERDERSDERRQPDSRVCQEAREGSEARAGAIRIQSGQLGEKSDPKSGALSMCVHDRGATVSHLLERGRVCRAQACCARDRSARDESLRVRECHIQVHG